MNRIGPSLEAVTRRLAETPADFLGEPRIGTRGTIVVAAVVNDVLAGLGLAAAPDLLRLLNDPKADRNALTLAMILAWLLADEWFAAIRPEYARVARLFIADVPELAAQVRADLYVTDPDRREELVRTMLAGLDFRPAGETVQQASDRLSRISAAERRRLLEAGRASEERARQIREALARKAAQESTDKWTRE